MTDDSDREFWREMRNRLHLYEVERRHSYKIHIRSPQPEIDVMAFKVAIEVNYKRTFGKVLHALVKHRHEIRSDVRRYLIKRLRQQVAIVRGPGALWKINKRDWRKAKTTAERCAQLWDSIADQLEQPRDKARLLLEIPQCAR